MARSDDQEVKVKDQEMKQVAENALQGKVIDVQNDNISKLNLWDGAAVDDQSQKQPQQEWPHWLPNDWFIYRDIGAPQSTSHVHYGNAKGKRFYSEEEVLKYLAKHQPKKKIHRQFRRKSINKANQDNNAEEKISPPENALHTQNLERPGTPWPEWLPHDWYIDRSHEDPTDVRYCSPKWKRFHSKDEVLHYLSSAKSMKASKRARKTTDITEPKIFVTHNAPTNTAIP